MSKTLFIAEKPSVAREFASALKLKAENRDGYIEANNTIVTWCVGHLITMSYPEVYDPALKKWRLDTLPFLPETFKYEVIPSAKKQYKIVEGLLRREDVSTIYVCTDSGREGEYIYRLVEQQSGIKGKIRKRVWIDSQTEEEIIRGIKQAKDLSEYDNLAAAAYLRAKEDYLMGINFSRLLSLKYGDSISKFMNTRYTVISVGRVMTCVLGMVVKREREIRSFVKTPFYRVLGKSNLEGHPLEGEWKAVEGSKYFESPLLYKENGFKKREDAEALIFQLSQNSPIVGVVEKVEKKKEVKNPPLLYNLAELQNECSKLFKINPDETLKIVQELYEKKLVTYPRTDARVLSTAVAKEIHKNINGLLSYPYVQEFAKEVLEKQTFKGLEKTRYVNDKQITDHYAIVPTGQGLSALRSVGANSQKVYEIIARRFLSIFYPGAEYQKLSLVVKVQEERFFYSFKVMLSEGYLKVTNNSFSKKKEELDSEDSNQSNEGVDSDLLEVLKKLKKGHNLQLEELFIKEGETSPPKRFSSGSIILAMENAGQLIEDEELRAQIKGSGIGTSATRAEILKKLISNKYIQLNEKTQILTPQLLGEMVYDVVTVSIRSLLNPELTASWEKGLTMVANAEISENEYRKKLEQFVQTRVQQVLNLNNQYQLQQCYQLAAENYKSKKR